MSESIKDILESFQTKYKEREAGSIKVLENTVDTWIRINSGDSFEELGFSSVQEKEDFLKEWIAENPYSALVN